MTRHWRGWFHRIISNQSCFRQCPKCRYICGVYLIRAGERACIKRWSEFDSGVLDLRQVTVQWFFPSPFPIPPLLLSLCISISGYRLILSVLSLVINSADPESDHACSHVYSATPGPSVVNHSFFFLPTDPTQTTQIEHGIMISWLITLLFLLVINLTKCHLWLFWRLSDSRSTYKRYYSHPLWSPPFRVWGTWPTSAVFLPWRKTSLYIPCICTFHQWASDFVYSSCFYASEPTNSLSRGHWLSLGRRIPIPCYDMMSVRFEPSHDGPWWSVLLCAQLEHLFCIYLSDYALLFSLVTRPWGCSRVARR